MSPRLSFLFPPESEAKLFASWLNDPEVVQYSEQRHKVHTVQSQLDYWDSQATKDPNRYLGIYLDKGNKFIGSVSAEVDLPNEVANVGIMIGDKREWRKGYGFEAWDAFCNLLFKSGIRKVEAGLMHINAGMKSVCVKYGMDLEGRLLDHFKLLPGNPTKTADMLRYGKFR